MKEIIIGVVFGFIAFFLVSAIVNLGSQFDEKDNEFEKGESSEKTDEAIGVST